MDCIFVSFNRYYFWFKPPAILIQIEKILNIAQNSIFSKLIYDVVDKLLE